MPSERGEGMAKKQKRNKQDKFNHKGHKNGENLNETQMENTLNNPKENKDNLYYR